MSRLLPWKKWINEKHDFLIQRTLHVHISHEGCWGWGSFQKSSLLVTICWMWVSAENALIGLTFSRLKRWSIIQYLCNAFRTWMNFLKFFVIDFMNDCWVGYWWTRMSHIFLFLRCFRLHFLHVLNITQAFSFLCTSKVSLYSRIDRVRIWARSDYISLVCKSNTVYHYQRYLVVPVIYSVLRVVNLVVESADVV